MAELDTLPRPATHETGDAMPAPVLALRDIRVRFQTSSGPLDAVRGAGFSLRRGETLALVGESGSGKSTLARAITRQTQPPFTRNVTFVSGTALLARAEGPLDLIAADRRTQREVRARDIALISQDALSGLNPVMTIGAQMVEALRVVEPGLDRRAARMRAASLLAEVELPDPEATLRRYPHQFSGGQRQRVMIAMAIAREPAVLIADEPTTALDATVQSRILDLLKREQTRHGMAMLFISHDIGAVLRIADKVGVMYAGQIVELAPVARFRHQPRHPYTEGLLASRPGYRGPVEPLSGYAPPPRRVPGGCAFHPRCRLATARCTTEMPPEIPDTAVEILRCWRPL